MIDTATPDMNDHPAEWARPLYAQHIALLGELAEMGMEAARAVSGQIKAGDADLQPLAMAFSRMARAVRVTLMLQARFIKDLEAYDRNGEYRTTVAANARKDQVTRIVERVIDAEANDPDHAEKLTEDVADRLDHDDIYGLVLNRPVSELVAMICKDLGLSPDWPALAREAWAVAEMAGGEVGWPLANPPLERFKHEGHEGGTKNTRRAEPFVTFVPPS